MKLVRLLFLILLFAACKVEAQRAYTLGVATHHENFWGYGVDSWHNNWIPGKVMVAIPIAENYQVMPTASFGRANYAQLPKRLFWNFDVNIKRDFTQTRLQPYAMIGYGVTHVEFENYKRDYYAEPNVGLGLNFWITKAFGLNAQTNYNLLPGFHNYHQASLGLVFRLFGKNMDCDGDGFADEVDPCPDEFGAETGCPDADGDGIADNDDMCPTEHGSLAAKGCPDQDGDGIQDNEDQCPTDPGTVEFSGCPDSDGDGIMDVEDSCPNEAGVKSLNGCPDKDGDGIADKNDSCPDVAGLESLKGCPDKDGDGIADKDDRCPDVPGIAALNGCPEADEDTPEEVEPIEEDQPAPVDEVKIQPISGINILFDTGKANVKSQYLSTLNGLIGDMKRDGTIKYRVEGHADSMGNASRNQQLSRQRAEAVKRYMTSKGVPASRISTKGFGSDRPVAPNDTEDGRGKNRRVEIHLDNN